MPHDLPSVLQQTLLNELVFIKLPSDISHVKRSFKSKDVQQQVKWTFKLGVGEFFGIPLFVMVGFHLTID